MFFRLRRSTTRLLLVIWLVVTVLILWQWWSKIQSAMQKIPRHPHYWEKDKVQPITNDYLERMRSQFSAGMGRGLGGSLKRVAVVADQVQINYIPPP